jgi:16S rRNA (guanine527-N7)-methyltransferase
MSLDRISDSSIMNVLQVYDFNADNRYVANMKKYAALLKRWNQRISLTTITSVAEVVQRHFGESVFALRFADLSSGRLADVGSGAGFPALAIKLACPGLSMRLYEANRKKCAFLHEVVRELEMENIEIISRRTTESSKPAPFANFVTARALGSYEELLEWAESSLLPGGLIILWLGLEDSDQIRMVEGWKWRPAVPIPRTKSRVIQIGQIAN